MADNMIERVAKAIFLWSHGPGELPPEWSEVPQHVKDDAFDQARASIKVMREPTDEMVYTRHHHIEPYQAMIDAALNEGE